MIRAAMAAVTELQLPTIDYLDPALAGPAFRDTLRDLRERSWVARAEPLGWFVLDHEATAFFLRTRAATFPGRTVLEVQGVTSGPLYERLRGNLLDLDGEAHRRLRKLIQPAFTPKAADGYRPAMRAQLAELFGAVAGAGRCDVVAALAKPYPARMIATVMGAPLADAPRLQEWANVIQGQFDPVKLSTELPALERAATEFEDYARGLLSERRRAPADDMISTLIAAEEDGDRLADEECLAIVSSVLVGGVDTTQSQLAHGLRLFAEHPEQWRALAADPALVPAAVEEVLRYEPIAPFTARITLEDVEFRDVLFPRGTLVFACAHTANRDPAGYDAPEAFDIAAPRERARPLSFGAGPHFCLGASLARAELQEALAFLAPRLPGLALDGAPVYDTPLGVYGLRELPVRWATRRRSAVRHVVRQ
jgi:cytochrome P450